MILYFSGTGNSRYVAEALAEMTGDTVVNIGEYLRAGRFPVLYSEEPWVFVCPVYAWRMPRIVENWIAKTKFTGDRNAYFIITCGDSIGDAGKYLKPLCRDKRFILQGVQDVVMPENYIAMFNAPDREEAEKIRRAAYPKIRRLATCIRANLRFPERKVSALDKMKSALVTSPFYSICITSKGFSASDACISCRKCEKQCPVRGIEMKGGKPTWTGPCVHCMACICTCPAQAIEFGLFTKGKVRYECPPYSYSK